MKPQGIYCYFEPVFGHDPLVDYWCEVWAGQGWEPHVLGSEDAKRHPRYELVCQQADALPTVNHPGYERSCYLRWCAFAQHDGAVCDYDVLPTKPFPPREFLGFFCGGAGGPGFIWGHQADYERVIDLILGYRIQPDDLTFGQPHVSDMTIMVKAARNLFTEIQGLAPAYGTPRWEDQPLTHFGNAYRKRTHEMSRLNEIKLVMNDRTETNERSHG